MQLLAISLGRPREIEHNGQTLLTGIYKTPVAESTAVQVTYLGVVGDNQVDGDNHGGPDKALYVYSADNYGYWQEQFGGIGWPYGQFGENLTVDALSDETVCVGDVYQIGEILVQVTQPRVPCFKLGVRMGVADFPQQFMFSRRVGFYLRVLQPGRIQAGDAISLVQADAERLNIADCMLALQSGPHQRDIMRRVLSVAALSDAWRDDLSRRLAATR